MDFSRTSKTFDVLKNDLNNSEFPKWKWTKLVGRFYGSHMFCQSYWPFRKSPVGRHGDVKIVQINYFQFSKQLLHKNMPKKIFMPSESFLLPLFSFSLASTVMN